MVKGITRRVVMVKSPDPKIFDEAIFLVREDAKSGGVTTEEIMREARDAAENYIRENEGAKLPFRLPPYVYALLGAGGTGLAWLLTAIFL